METPMKKPFGPARIAAIVLIALAAAGLAYLRFAPGAGSVSVPAGAHTGQLALHPCTYATERGSYRADCGTLVVPENRHDARSRLIALPVTRVRARSADPGAPIFRLEGGPGLTNMVFKDASRFAGDHDVVLVGYRGVDGSVRLDCPEVESALKHSADLLGQKSFGAYQRGYQSCANRLRSDGVDLAGYSLPERVDDLEAARRALGYHRVDLISESAGTRTAMIYAWRYPKAIHRSVMIGVNPPGNYLWYPKTTDEQIRKYSALCAGDESCSARTNDLAATLRTTSTHLPDHWWFLPIKSGNVRLGSFFGLMNSTSAASPISAPMTLSSWISAAKDDPSGLWLMSVLSQLVFPTAQVKGDVAAVSRTDAGFADRYYAAARNRSILGSPGTDFLWGGGKLRNAWPAGPDDDEYSSVRTSRVPTLLIGGDLDFATPPQNATRELLPHLPNGHQVVLPNLGHTDDFWSYEPGASSHLINTFLASGKVDDSRYASRTVEFTSGVTQATLAKIILSVMLGFAGLAILSLLGLALRVHKRGGIGSRAGVAIRSLYVLVLGLGGWFAGALIALIALPTVPLDSELLAGLSVGVPVGLGIYFAWVRRDWPTRTKSIGLAAALGAGLVGAWLGFGAVAGLFGVVTAIVGAAVGANLIVLVLDIARDRPERAAAAATSSTPALR